MQWKIQVAVRTVLIINLLAIGSTISQSVGFNPSGSTSLTDMVSSSMFNEASASSDAECIIRCWMRGCALATVSSANGQCQTIVLNDASKAASLPGSNVHRVLGASAGDRVWKTADYDDQLLSKSIKNVSLKFANSGTGSNGTIQSALINMTGCYRIEAWGAKGGTSANTTSVSYTGGNGATMTGNFNLTAGTQLAVVVGQRGGDPTEPSSYAGTGGGGGSFVYTILGNNLLLAAGGGGGGALSNVGLPGQADVNGTRSNPTTSPDTGDGGVNGGPAFTNTSHPPFNPGGVHGGCGAGWLGRAIMDRVGPGAGDRGGGLAEGWLGGLAGQNNAGAVGGFGGGGGGAQENGASGGGGGFSGGGTGRSYANAGGGGGSFCGGGGCVGVTGGNTGSEQGFVGVQLVSFSC